MILFWIKTSVRECSGSSSILFCEIPLWSYDHMKVTAVIFYYPRSLWREITTVLEFMMLLFFLGHVFGSTIIQCVGACSSSIQFLHAYHCMINGWWARSFGHGSSRFGSWCLKIFMVSLRLVNHLRHTRSSMNEKRHKSPKTPPIIRAISGNLLSYGSGIFWTWNNRWTQFLHHMTSLRIIYK